MKYILCIFLIASAFTSCQKEVDGGVSNSGGSNGGGGTELDYQPVSANSEWYYESSSGNTSHTVSLGTDTMISGLRYYKFNKTSNGDTERGYISKENGVYHTYGKFDPIGVVVELIYLKDSAIGTNWTNRITVNGFSNYHKYTVAKKDIQHTVKGRSYSNVIELNYEFSIDDVVGGGVLNVGGGKYYYAKGVGLIEGYVGFGFSGSLSSDTTRLVNYIIR